MTILPMRLASTDCLFLFFHLFFFYLAPSITALALQSIGNGTVPLQPIPPGSNLFNLVNGTSNHDASVFCVDDKDFAGWAAPDRQPLEVDECMNEWLYVTARYENIRKRIYNFYSRELDPEGVGSDGFPLPGYVPRTYPG